MDVARVLNWDYTYAPEDIADVLLGKRERVGHFDRPRLFARMLKPCRGAGSWKLSGSSRRATS